MPVFFAAAEPDLLPRDTKTRVAVAAQLLEDPLGMKAIKVAIFDDARKAAPDALSPEAKVAAAYLGPMLARRALLPDIIGHCHPPARRITGAEIAINIGLGEPGVLESALGDLGMKLGGGFVRSVPGLVFEYPGNIGLPPDAQLILR